MNEHHVPPGLDLDAFLAQPLVAHLATVGPNVIPIWFLWEQQAFWWLTGDWSRLLSTLQRDPAVALAVDTCDLATGRVLQVLARGTAEPRAFDTERARRWGHRYLGPDERHWGRFADGVFSNRTTRFVRLVPAVLRARDLSFEPSL